MDLKLRGPGDIEGTQQSGILNLKLADIVRDSKILQAARDAAAQLIQKDPNLNFPEHRPLKQYLEVQSKNTRSRWSKIS